MSNWEAKELLPGDLMQTNQITFQEEFIHNEP